MNELAPGNDLSQKSLAVSRNSALPGQYLTFVLGGEAYAIRILNIKEIIDFGNLTEVPMMPSFVKGIINLRGSVVPVVDLLARFGRKSTPIAKRTCIVIVETTNPGEAGEQEYQQDIGIIVDAVNEVVEIDAKEIEPPPAFGAKIRPDFVNGMAKLHQTFIILLNVNRVLSVDEMATLGKMAMEDQHFAAVA